MTQPKDEPDVNDRCPVCGHTVVKADDGKFYCASLAGHRHAERPMDYEELIGEDDDYEWCL